MHVNVTLGRFEHLSIEDGYEDFAKQSIFTQPERMEQDIENAIADMAANFVPNNEDERLGVVHVDIEATDAECRKMMRTIASNHVFNAVLKARRK